MPKHSYQLVNPIIEGTFKDVYDAKDSIEAAHDMWTNLTEHVVAHVPKFMFTMRDISNGELHHFEVVEDKEKGTFVIDKLNIDTKKDDFSDFEKRIDKYNKVREQRNTKKNDDRQDGGTRKRYDDEKDRSSSSSSSSTDIYPTIRRTSPIALFHYNTRVYYTGETPVYQSTLNPRIVGVAAPIFTPIFKPILGTFVAIWP
jgi:hypothetical protein